MQLYVSLPVVHRQVIILLSLIYQGGIHAALFFSSSNCRAAAHTSYDSVSSEISMSQYSTSSGSSLIMAFTSSIVFPWKAFLTASVRKVRTISRPRCIADNSLNDPFIPKQHRESCQPLTGRMGGCL